MCPLPAPVITCKSLRLLSEMDRGAAVILMLKAIGVCMVTAITEIMTVTQAARSNDWMLNMSLQIPEQLLQSSHTTS